MSTFNLYNIAMAYLITIIGFWCMKITNNEYLPLEAILENISPQTNNSIFLFLYFMLSLRIRVILLLSYST